MTAKTKSKSTTTVKKRPGNNKEGFMKSFNKLPPGENSKILKHSLEIYNWDKIDTNSTEEVEERICKYFLYCFENDIRPGVEGMALAIGVNRKTMYSWETEHRGSNPERAATIKKAKQFLADYMEQLSVNGKINPVSAIFLMKNHFGYTDKQEVTIAPTNPLGDEITPERIAESIPIDVESKEIE